MDWELVFKLANASVIPAWLLLLFVPNHRITRLAVHSHAYSAVLAILYVVLLVISFGGEGGMDTLANLKISFQRDEILVLGWVHYLAFDLFVGAWIARDAKKHETAHRIVVLPLLLTLFVGPVGLLSYLLIRKVNSRPRTL